MPLIPSLDDLLNEPHEEIQNRSIFSIIEDETLVNRTIAATEGVLGDMMLPGTGIIAVLPLARVHGLNHNWKKGK